MSCGYSAFSLLIVFKAFFAVNLFVSFRYGLIVGELNIWDNQEIKYYGQFFALSICFHLRNDMIVLTKWGANTIQCVEMNLFCCKVDENELVSIQCCLENCVFN